MIVLIIISEEIKTYLELIFKAMEVFTKTFPAKQFKKAYLIISFPFVCVLVCEMVFFFFFFFCPFFSFEVLVCYITLRKDQVLYFSNIIKLCIGNSCADNGKLSWHGVIMAS